MPEPLSHDADLLVITGDLGVVLLPASEIELARELTDGGIDAALLRTRVSASGGAWIPAADESGGAGAWAVAASVDDVTISQLDPEPVVDPLETFVPTRTDERPGHVGAGEPLVTADDADGSRFDALFGATVPGRRIEDAAVRDTPIEPSTTDGQGLSMAPSLPSVPDRRVEALHDGRTITPEQFAALKVDRIRRERHMSPSSPSRPRVTLRMPNGEVVKLESVVIFGRRPQPRSIGSEASPRLIVVDNPYVSGTHAEVRFDGPRVVVTDLSSNGTLLTKPGLPTHALVPNEPTELEDGSSLQLTDGLVVAVAIEAM